ncbi:hypothetical protein [Streptomyces sp. NPDC012616]|uniref:hypothetical protein n=1 Tax=Streptomyces sp. NPDC012616 TaxID=3364840 RepID=UPI0036E7E731
MGDAAQQSDGQDRGGYACDGGAAWHGRLLPAEVAFASTLGNDRHHRAGRGAERGAPGRRRLRRLPDVTLEDLDGQSAPCRRIAPGGRAAFAGDGPQLNRVTDVRTCGAAAPDTVTPPGPAQPQPGPAGRGSLARSVRPVRGRSVCLSRRPAGTRPAPHDEKG